MHMAMQARSNVNHVPSLELGFALAGRGWVAVVHLLWLPAASGSAEGVAGTYTNFEPKKSNFHAHMGSE